MRLKKQALFCKPVAVSQPLTHATFFPVQEVEDLVGNMVVELMSSRSEIGRLRQKCDVYDAEIIQWKRKATAFQKQSQDLNTVMRKYITDVKARPGDKVAPIKITRSVGLQVIMQSSVSMASEFCFLSPFLYFL